MLVMGKDTCLWNSPPRDMGYQPAALEWVLAGMPMEEGEIESVAVQPIVCSFDPSMVCTVH